MKPEVTLVYNKAKDEQQKSVLLETKSEVRRADGRAGRAAGFQVHNKVLRAHMRAYIMHVLNGYMYVYPHTYMSAHVSVNEPTIKLSNARTLNQRHCSGGCYTSSWSWDWDRDWDWAWAWAQWPVLPVSWQRCPGAESDADDDERSDNAHT